MRLKQLFRNELGHLRQRGEAFARENPQLARFLGEKAADPDVERLLEGFAFLTAKLRMKLEDDLPELTHSLLQLLWPNYLRPIPSLTIVRFDPVDRAIVERQVLKKGTSLQSLPIDGTRCQFRTCTDVVIFPLCIRRVTDAHTRDRSIVRVELSTLSDQPLHAICCDQLDLCFAGDATTASTLYLWMARYLVGIRATVDGNTTSLDPRSIIFPGFSPGDSVLPQPRNVFDGYRIIQEYFVFPQRFLFARLTGLVKAWPESPAGHVLFEFEFSRPMPSGIRVGDDDIVLYCTPAVNLFEHDAEPISLDGKKVDYRLQPSGKQSAHCEIFSIDRVCSWKRESAGPAGEFLREFHAFESLEHEIEHAHGRASLYYRSRVEASKLDDGLMHRVAFVRSDESLFIGRNETISVELTCTNRDLASALGAADICVPTSDTPTFATFASIMKPTPCYRPVLDGALQWTLISNLSLNYLSLLSPEPLKAVVRAYDFAALHDIQNARATRARMDAVKTVTTQPADVLMGGVAVRGLRTTMELDQSAFVSEGDLYLFASALSHFFALYASINSFHELTVINTQNKETYTWPILRGGQPVI
jgi:type VI secretion system protein ImpG